MADDDNQIKILVPIWGSFGLAAQKITYRETPEMRGSASLYVQAVVSQADLWHQSTGGYFKHFAGRIDALREATANANPAYRAKTSDCETSCTLPEIKVPVQVIDNECLLAARGLGLEKEFRAADEKIKARTQSHHVAQAAPSFARFVLGS